MTIFHILNSETHALLSVSKIVKHCTAGLFSLSSDKFNTVIMTILFAMKHEKPELMEIGLETMSALN